MLAELELKLLLGWELGKFLTPAGLSVRVGVVSSETAVELR